MFGYDWIIIVLCAEGCILRMPGSLMKSVFAEFAGGVLLFRNYPKYRGNTVQISVKICMLKAG